MTNAELQLFRVALKWLFKYKESNPDVGLGPSLKILARQIAEEAGIVATQHQLDDIANYVRTQMYHRDGRRKY